MKKTTIVFSSLLITFLLASCSSSGTNTSSISSSSGVTSTSVTPTNPADKVIYGNIITMDEANPSAKAIAIKDGKILALGQKEDVSKYIGSNTTIDKYDNDYVYPGFVDTHTHYAVMSNIMAGGFIFDREKSGEGGYALGDYEAYAKLIKGFVEANPNKEVYQAYGLWVADNPKYPRGQTPTAKMLDDVIETNKPIVVIGGGGHDCWLNTAAIKQYVGNFEGTEEEKNAVDKWIEEVGNDCVISEDVGGHKIPQGYFFETARFRITDNLPHTVDEIKDFIVTLQDASLVKGYTTVGDCTIVESAANKQVTAFKELDAAGQLKLKYRSYYEIREYDSESVRERELQKAFDLMNETKGNEHFQIVGIKIFLDGVYEALSAYTLNEYTPESGKREGYKGIGRWKNTQTELNNLVKKANEGGLAVEFHAMGDAAIKQALDACEYAAEQLNVTGTPNYRNAISHLGYIDPVGVDEDGLTKGLKDIERFNKLGVTAVVAPQWTSANTSIYPQETKVLGNDRVDNMYLIKSIVDTGANVAFHTDGAVLGGVPEMIYDATTRKDAANPDSVIKVRAPEECISGKVSLNLLTTSAAYTLKSENSLGCIKVGYAADFTIYNKDYTKDEVATSLEEFKSAQLLALYSNGVEISKN